MKDYIYEENGIWHYDEQLYPESRGWVTRFFKTKEQAEAYRDERENPGLAKMAGGEVERVDGLRAAIGFMEAELALRINSNMPQTLMSSFIEKLLEAARIQLKRQGE